MSSEKYDHIYKLLIIGDSSVGKSSLLLRFTDNKYQDSYISTIGVDFKVKTMNINDQVIKLQIWDTAGQERFRTITAAYYKGAHGIAIVFAYDSRESFDNVQSWIENIKQYAGNVNMILIGNKSDVSEKKVDENEVIEMAKEKGIPYFSSSAKDNVNVDQCFEGLVKTIMENNLKNEDDDSSKIDLGKKSKKGKECC